MMAPQIMVDLETLSTQADAAIVSIGAVVFDPEKDELGEEFYVEISIESNDTEGLHISGSTLTWWQQQSEEAQSLLERCDDPEQSRYLSAALQDFSYYLAANRTKNSGVWGNGASFDNVILHNAYSTVGLPSPWPFYMDRCYRTLKSLGPKVKFERVGTYHNALDDAKTQAQHALDIIKELGIKELR